MTVPAAERKAGPFNGNGSTTAFPFTFKVFTDEDVEVVVADTNGVETVLTLSSDYSVSLNSDQDASPGGTVTYPISGTALATGEKLSIAGALAYEQETDIPTGGNFNPTVLENALDKLSMQTQQLAESVSRAAKVPITNAADAADLAQAILVAANNITDLQTIVSNISDIQTVADDLNEATSEIDTVATSIANVNAVGNNISNVNTVAGISSNVTTVAGVSSNVTTVAGISAAVSGVAAISTAVSAVNSNASNVNTVAGISAAVSSVAADATDIGTVATNIADVNSVASSITAVNSAYTNMAAILDAPAQASAAAASAAAAALTYDSFDDRYLGAKNSAPSVDNDGNALTSGAMYFNTGVSVADDKGMWIYDGSTWIKASSAAQAILVNYKYVATADQTVFTGADANSLTLSYTSGSIIVAVGGVVQSPDTYTATNGTSVTFSAGVSAGVVVNIYSFSSFDVANTYTQAQADTLLAGKLSSAAGAVTRTNAANDLLGVTQNAQSSSYTLALTDIGKHVYSANSGAQTITVPTNASVAFPVGAAITLVNNGTTAITISTTSITLYQAGTANTGNRTLGTKGVATLLKVATDTWFVSGAGLT